LSFFALQKRFFRKKASKKISYPQLSFNELGLHAIYVFKTDIGCFCIRITPEMV